MSEQMYLHQHYTIITARLHEPQERRQTCDEFPIFPTLQFIIPKTNFLQISSMGKNPYASLSQPNIISPSSSFKPKLSDQDYMELVCENGQIIAKSRRPNNGSFENLRTESILDLYETEYDEGFKKNIKNLGDSQVVPGSESQHPQQDEETDEQTSDSNHKKKIKPSKTESERDVWKRNKLFESSKLMNDSLKGLKNVEVITSPPDEQSAAVGRSKELYVASSSKFSRGTSRDLSCCYLKKRKYSDMEEEESTYLSNPVDAKTRVTATTRKTVAKKKRSTKGHKLSERKRRNEISRKMRELQDLLPNCYKDDKVSLLDEAIKYMRTLQLQVQMMSMGNGMIPSTSTMLPMGHYSPMGLGMHMDKVDETTSAVVDVVSGKEMKGGGEDVLDDATILMYVEQIKVVYSVKALELAVVDGTATENEKTVDNKDGEVAEDDEEDEEDYDYNKWHDFVSRNCEWDDGKDEEGGTAGGQSGGRTNKSNVGVRGEVAPRKAVGGKTAD
ncbi:hypothetical protein Bca52824_003193 [Brassica carinata]|uniref:BHLH domain-containing protein n=1 Tax=Brassica carinata TaxID=52824 RepID=A0A8X7WJB6_BRACI|nr:hypothetical protein Bca52824_003193 [Brassica carinata]